MTLVRLFVVFLASICTLQAQVQVQPSSVYLSDTRTSATLQLRSTASAAQSLTTRIANKEESDPSAHCADWVAIDPGSCALPSGGTTTLNVTVRIPAGTAQGEYVADLFVETGSDEHALRLPVHVRVGDVYSDVKLANVGAVREEDEVRFEFHFQQMGNAAYRGNMDIRIEDGRGKAVYSRKGPLDVYGKSTEKVVLPSVSVPKGRYKVRMRFDTEREDLGDKAIPIMPKNYTVDISMP